MAHQAPLPTLGYPSQKAACIALFLSGEAPTSIAVKVGASINSVHRALTEYRKANGISKPQRQPRAYIPGVNECDPLWEMDEDQRRDEIRRRAAAAARATRLAA